MNKNDAYIIDFINETTQLIADEKCKSIAEGINSYSNSLSTVNEVEFWKWMNSNYKKSGFFHNSQSIADYISRSENNANWMKQQLQGKGYEWDWMIQEQSKIKNITNSFDAGIDPTQAGIDVTKKNILTKKTSTFQHKSYLNDAKVNSHVLKNTPNDAVVITQKENVSSALDSGYSSESFQSKSKSSKILDKRFNKASNGLTKTSYNIKTVSHVLGKAAFTGIIIGATTESILSYNKYKSGHISKSEYLRQIKLSSLNSATTSAITSGLMIPIHSTVISAGLSIPITIPIAIGLSFGVDKIVAPFFGRGQYIKDLNEMNYYKDIGNAYINFIIECEKSFKHFNSYIDRIKLKEFEYSQIKKSNIDLNIDLRNILNRI